MQLKIILLIFSFFSPLFFLEFSLKTFHHIDYNYLFSSTLLPPFADFLIFPHQAALRYFRL